ncbi:MAG: neutral zinc metallopeptidase [Proteobacteria bacterium]|nr:neutral zinc metallopeptidase [Pseudomonadota bacterium]MBU1138364.1 neutral zinc metallopeptidase [Pseudomonadota bacterium]MBU1233699.1 neutral zinc metallopeptidase [Pseudomonadota bacterium]MBU1420840.1 neutral zinc metallopeptidase [Pseudomonadota bacterium]MBU1453505.1 neutral zinc metallopeptidase [Pseudomonadota bacterium]
MRWKDGRRSFNILDKRGIRLSGKTKGGGIGILVVALIAMYFGIDPSFILQQGDLLNGTSHENSAYTPTESENEQADFVSVVLANTEDTWGAIFKEYGQTYQQPELVLFTGEVESACGYAQAATGPFYCPADQQVYIDLSFFQELRNRLDAPGDFAQAYVVAHEIGHHIQKLTGISDQVHAKRQTLSKVAYNKLSVRLELQADCLAGVWAHHADKMQNILEPGDTKEALHAAAMIGDDRLQKQGRGYVVPDSFTHGSSSQRVKWFRQGFDSGDMQTCDTFNSSTSL